MSSKNNKVLYVGVTNDLIRQVYEHRNGLVEGFTKKYNCKKLVWFSQAEDIKSAIVEEKRMKKWKREYKENIINAMNSTWEDLYNKIV